MTVEEDVVGVLSETTKRDFSRELADLRHRIINQGEELKMLRTQFYDLISRVPRTRSLS